MKKVLFILIFILFSFLSLNAEWQKVRYVIDGDTVVLSNGEHVRLIGVDTPEIKSKYHPKNDYYAIEAKEYASKVLTGKKVFLREEELQSHEDKYGRRLAYIFLEDGTFFNRELVRLGYAKPIYYFPYKYKKDFLWLAEQAEKKGLGLWKKKK